MSFNLYFAGWGSKDADIYLRSKEAHRLLSWVNEGRVIDWWESDNLAHKLFIDSGAYSVAHSGRTIEIDDYIKFIKDNPKIKNWAELDVIPYPVLNTETADYCSKKSWENYVYMRERINHTHILPVFHYGEPKSALCRILNTRVNGELVDYIGVGGRHGFTTAAQINYFKKIFAIIHSSDNPNVKVHAFGITVPAILEKFPFYSADSTTWLQAAINGSIVCDDLSTVTISDGRLKGKDNIRNMPDDAVASVLSFIERRNYKFTDLCSDYKLRLRYNIDVMLDWEKHYKYKGPKRFKSQRLF